MSRGVGGRSPALDSAPVIAFDGEIEIDAPPLGRSELALQRSRQRADAARQAAVGISKAQKAMQVLARRQTVTRMYLQGKTQQQIADALKTRPSQVAADLKAVRQFWLRSMVTDYNEMRAAHLAKLDALEAEYWDAWAKSQQNQIETITSQSGGEPETSGQSDDLGDPAERIRRRVSETKRVASSYGDPRFLQGIERVLAMKERILGLGAGERAKAVLLGAAAAGNLSINLSWGDTVPVIEAAGVVHDEPVFAAHLSPGPIDLAQEIRSGAPGPDGGGLISQPEPDE